MRTDMDEDETEEAYVGIFKVILFEVRLLYKRYVSYVLYEFLMIFKFTHNYGIIA